jgi:hypothetical protein
MSATLNAPAIAQFNCDETAGLATAQTLALGRDHSDQLNDRQYKKEKMNELFSKRKSPKTE